MARLDVKEEELNLDGSDDEERAMAQGTDFLRYHPCSPPGLCLRVHPHVFHLTSQDPSL